MGLEPQNYFPGAGAGLPVLILARTPFCGLASRNSKYLYCAIYIYRASWSSCSGTEMEWSGLPRSRSRGPQTCS